MISKDAQELELAISNFVSSFELVFDKDWENSKNCIANSKYLIEDGGTFINPGVDNESNNWANRGSLLADYWHLVELLDRQGISHRFEDVIRRGNDSNVADSDF